MLLYTQEKQQIFTVTESFHPLSRLLPLILSTNRVSSAMGLAAQVCWVEPVKYGCN